jgi:hypothetical protein
MSDALVLSQAFSLDESVKALAFYCEIGSTEFATESWSMMKLLLWFVMIAVLELNKVMN